MVDTTWTPAINTGIRITILDGEAVLLDGENERVHQLDAIGTRMLRTCDGKRSIDEIVAHLLAEYEVEETRLRNDVVELLMRLKSLGVLA